MNSEEIIFKRIHRHDIGIDEKYNVVWLCGCRGHKFLPGEREELEKLFKKEAKKHDSQN